MKIITFKIKYDDYTCHYCDTILYNIILQCESKASTRLVIFFADKGEEDSKSAANRDIYACTSYKSIELRVLQAPSLTNPALELIYFWLCSIAKLHTSITRY